MSYFLFADKLNLHQEVAISGEEFRHLIARRAQIGEKVFIQGVDEKRYIAEIVEINRNNLKLMVSEEVAVPVEPAIQVALFQSIVSEKALDFIFQKSTELGAYSVNLFNSHNTATKLSKDKFKEKQERWEKILWEAAKQCDRVRPPKLGYLEGLDEVVAKLVDYDQVVLLEPSGKQIKTVDVQSKKSIAIIVGPEGGLTEQEIKKIKILPSSHPVSLGPILLRAETASLAGLAIIQNI